MSASDSPQPAAGGPDPVARTAAQPLGPDGLPPSDTLGQSQQRTDTGGTVAQPLGPDGLPAGPGPARFVPPRTLTQPPGGPAGSGPASASREAMLLLPNVPGVRIVEALGQGAMGWVYRGEDDTVHPPRPVAVKVMRFDAPPHPKDVARFVQEGRSMSAVTHPNVVRVYATGQDGEVPYIVMEYLPGDTLGRRLDAAGGRLPVDQAVRLLFGVARGVQAAHALGIVHRDLKPDNVLFDAAGTPKVADFGVAKLDGHHVTQTGAVVGTPYYMSPEQASGAKDGVGPASDVWSLGVMLYELLSGRRPYTGATVFDVVRRVADGRHESLRNVSPEVPADLADVCSKCLERRPADRYPTAGELAADLGRYLAGRPVLARLGPAARLRKRLARVNGRRLAGLAVAVALVAGLGAAAALLRGTGPADDPERREFQRLRTEEVRRRLDVLLRSPPAADREQPHPATPLPAADTRTNDAFRVLEDDRVFDMRGWRPLAPADPPAGCVVTHAIRQRLVKAEPADAYYYEGRTMGADLLMRCLSPNPAAARLRTTAAGVHVGRQEMKWRQLAVDVAAQPLNEEFEVRIRSTFLGSLQKPDDLWLGVIGFNGSLKTSLLLLFPDARPMKGHKLLVAPTRNAEPEPFTGPRLTIQDEASRWFYWEIPSPRAGHVYRVDWEW